jgi:hypothetical protein
LEIKTNLLELILAMQYFSILQDLLADVFTFDFMDRTARWVFNSIEKSIAGQLQRALACAYFEELGIGKLMAALSTYQCSLPLAALSTLWWNGRNIFGTATQCHIWKNFLHQMYNVPNIRVKSNQ